MTKKIILVSKSSWELHQICRILSENRYTAHVVEEIEHLHKILAAVPSNCAILDLDSLDIDNPAIRKLTIQYPHVYFLCISRDRFHPELKDAICYHIYACLTKPLDYDELLYWLRCIENDVEPTVSHNDNENRHP